MVVSLISVVAPLLNEERYLPTFLQSLVHQRFNDFELIIVDGGSTDKSLQQLESYIPRLLQKGVPVRLIIDRTRNLGYIRNVGGDHANGRITIQCNTDNYFEPDFLRKIHTQYTLNGDLISLSGRVFPFGTSIFAHVGYQLFDLLRYIFTRVPSVIRKYRPSGNFTSFLTAVWNEVGGYPEVPVNEDGMLGERIDTYAKCNGGRVDFRLDMYVGHYVKKFEQMGGATAILFYFYALGNFSDVLKRLLRPVEQGAAKVFQGKQHNRLGLKDVLNGLWNWL